MFDSFHFFAHTNPKGRNQLLETELGCCNWKQGGWALGKEWCESVTNDLSPHGDPGPKLKASTLGRCKWAVPSLLSWLVLCFYHLEPRNPAYCTHIPEGLDEEHKPGCPPMWGWTPTLYSSAASSMGRTRWPWCSWLSLQMRHMGSLWSSQKSSCTCFMWRGHCGRDWGLWSPQLFAASELWHWKHMGKLLPGALWSPGAMEQLQEVCTQAPPCRSPSWMWQRGHAALSCDLPGDTAAEKSPQWKTHDSYKRVIVHRTHTFSVRTGHFPACSSLTSIQMKL